MSKLRPVEGDYSVSDSRITLVVSRWNSAITDNLLKGALAALERHHLSENNLHVLRVPGAFELPLASLKAATGAHTVDGIIALGCVIRGDTPHFEYVCSECTRGLGQVSRDTGIPVGFGLLTCDTQEQAELRSGDNSDNKGEEAALTVLEMISLLRQVR